MVIFSHFVSVYAIDASAIIEQAKLVVKENNLENIVELVSGKAEDVQLPEKVDVIVSEWMVNIGLTIQSMVMDPLLYYCLLLSYIIHLTHGWLVRMFILGCSIRFKTLCHCN